MLVLGRTVGEAIVISGDITVRILSQKGKTIRIGIDAPADVHILRSELLERDRNEQEDAA